MSYSKGIMWLDDTRISFVDGSAPAERIVKDTHKKKFDNVIDPFNFKQNYIVDTKGRFTPNLLVCDDMLNDGIITKQNPRKYKADTDIKETSLLGFGDIKDKIQQGDKGSNSRYYDLDLWFDKMLDRL